MHPFTRLSRYHCPETLLFFQPEPSSATTNALRTQTETTPLALITKTFKTRIELHPDNTTRDLAYSTRANTCLTSLVWVTSAGLSRLQLSLPLVITWKLLPNRKQYQFLQPDCPRSQSTSNNPFQKQLIKPVQPEDLSEELKKLNIHEKEHHWGAPLPFPSTNQRPCPEACNTVFSPLLQVSKRDSKRIHPKGTYTEVASKDSGIKIPRGPRSSKPQRRPLFSLTTN